MKAARDLMRATEASRGAGEPSGGFVGLPPETVPGSFASAHRWAARAVRLWGAGETKAAQGALAQARGFYRIGLEEMVDPAKLRARLHPGKPGRPAGSRNASLYQQARALMNADPDLRIPDACARVIEADEVLQRLFTSRTEANLRRAYNDGKKSV